MGERRGTKALELWCRRMTEGYPGVKVDNMTTSWRDGLAFCAMIHHFRPDLIEFEKLNKNDIYYNNELAFRTAEIHLGIPALLDAADMESYEVPDRLSILTYLSQYYQAFAAQDSPLRLNKRPATTIDKSAITKTPGPPAKMAHVGVPRREPCLKCGMPVFLAERLTIGKNLYHRTCLKCARCNTQLTPGSFYETEIDGEFCCETCPDEEKELSLKEKLEKDGLVGSSVTDGRSSIADKLAIFEKNGTGLLKKSLSDEEKRKSLKRMEEYFNQDINKTNKESNRAMSSFMNSQVVNEEPPQLPAMPPPSLPLTKEQPNQEEDDNEIEISSTEEDITEKSDTPSSDVLPTTKSPSDEKTETDIVCIPGKISSPFVDNLKDATQPTILATTITTTARISPIKDLIDPVNKINSIEISRKDDESEHVEKSIKDTDFSTSSSLINSKDNFNVNDELKKPLDALVEKQKSIVTKEDNNKNANEQNEIVKNNNMVRSRLRQFEELQSNCDQNNILTINSNFNNRKLSLNENKINETKLDNHENDSLAIEVPAVINTDSVSNYLHQENDAEIVVTTEITDIDNNKTSDIIEIVKENPIENDINNCQEKSVDTEINEIINNEADREMDKLEIAQSESITHDQNLIEKNSESLINNEEKPKNVDEYPEDLNPFGDSDNEEKSIADKSTKKKSLNPFDSEDDEEGADNKKEPLLPPVVHKAQPRKSTNPFGSDTDGETEEKSSPRRTPVPTPRKTIQSLPLSAKKTTPEPTPRVHHLTSPKKFTTHEFHGSDSSLGSTSTFTRSYDGDRGSANSLSSSSLSGSVTTLAKHHKRRAPPPPPPTLAKQNILTVPDTTVSKSNESSPSTSQATSPRTTPKPRKKRPAPAPPPSTSTPIQQKGTSINDEHELVTSNIASEISEIPAPDTNISDSLKNSMLENKNPTKLRLIPLEASLLDDQQYNEFHQDKEQPAVTYRRIIVPLSPDVTGTDDSLLSVDDNHNQSNVSEESHERQWEKMKDNKESKNRNRQSQISLPSPSAELDPLYSNKSSHGKWKRRKGPAPALPVPPKRVLQMLPLQEIRHELEVIEVQQLGLEKQGVMLEKIIRERCEGKNGTPIAAASAASATATCDEKDGPAGNDSLHAPSIAANVPNTKEVEDLIMQLFELVNEKNELFRRQAELMYLRRQYRLEQEQADLEYEIRVLMAQPERNKTDSDKAREEALILRLVEVVQLRNEVIDCLEMDRLREAEEDMSIKQQIEIHSARRDEELNQQTPTKLSKKEKKKQKEAKKSKNKKLDADKDDDESEITSAMTKEKKKKKKFLLI